MEDTVMAKVRQARKEMFVEMNAACMADALAAVYKQWLDLEHIGAEDVVRVTFMLPLGHQPSAIHREG